MLVDIRVMRVAVVHLLALELALDSLAVWGVTDKGQDWANSFDELRKESVCALVDQVLGTHQCALTRFGIL